MSKKNILCNKFSIIKDEEIVKKYKETSPWGMSISIDLYSANKEKIRDKKFIEKFIKELIPFINMKAFGKPMIVNFGDDPKVKGYSLMQLIETSSITAHFANDTNSIYLDIFSCKFFKPYETAMWIKKYFNAEDINVSQAIFRY